MIRLAWFALHFLWVVALIVMALGLGFTVANSRRDCIDVVNQRVPFGLSRIICHVDLLFPNLKYIPRLTEPTSSSRATRLCVVIVIRCRWQTDSANGPFGVVGWDLALWSRANRFAAAR